jgi:MinD superfamily P-loop ATPase
MKELVIISGKGGTGKTSVTASFAALSSNAVIADADVDASDLHLVLRPVLQSRQDFQAGQEARIDPARCEGCGQCRELCRFDAVQAAPLGVGTLGFRVDPAACEGCGVCAAFCPAKAIDLSPRIAGEWFTSGTRFGPLVHAALAPGGENSGKLVTQVREVARRIADDEGRTLILVDGPPGIACPVIASITGASLVLAVTEPTVSGEHDLERVLALTARFAIPTFVCINKYDLNLDLATRMENRAEALGARITPRIPYDHTVTRAQVLGIPVVEMDEGMAGAAMRAVWNTIQGELHGLP